MQPLRIGIIGTGDIAPRYLTGAAAAPGLHLAGCAGRTPGRAGQLAARFGVPAFTVAEMLAHPAIDAVVNLSAPADHAAITSAALRAGKHVYTEKPLAVDEADADALLELSGNAVLACAPAVTLGPALQTARALIDEGAIGDVVGAAATLVYPGPDRWHHNPGPLFAAGAGPLFDMGVYDLAALHFLLGPVSSVSAAARTMRQTRTIAAGPQAGQTIAVNTPTHIAALLSFSGGPVATLTASFDGFGSAAPGLEIYGTQGALRLDRPAVFDTPVAISRRFRRWEPVGHRQAGWTDACWIAGLLDMAHAVRTGTPPRLSAAVGRHLLAAMHAVLRAATSGRAEAVGHPATRAAPLPPGDYPNVLEGSAA